MRKGTIQAKWWSHEIGETIRPVAAHTSIPSMGEDRRYASAATAMPPKSMTPTMQSTSKGESPRCVRSRRACSV